MTGKRTLLAAAVCVATFCVVVGSAGGRTTASNANASVVLTPLIGTSTNDIPQVTFGGKMGFHLEVSNTGTSTFNHLVIVVDSGPGTTFADSSQPNVCAKDPKDATRMICKLVQLKPTDGVFSVDLRFTAPLSGSSVDTSSSLTTDAQTQGSPGNSGTQTFNGNTVTTNLVSDAGNSLLRTFARGTEAIATGALLFQHSKFTMPNSLNGLFGVDTSVFETTGTPLCDKCPAFVTQLDIPISLTNSSPFSPTNPFLFTITLLPDGWPSGYQPTGLYHDDGTGFVKVPMCADSDLSPTVVMCLTSFKAKKSTGIIAEGRAWKNGKNGFG